VSGDVGIPHYPRGAANKGEGAEDKGGIMLSIQGQQRDKMSDEYIDTPKRSKQITWTQRIELFKNYLSLSSTLKVHTPIRVSHFPTTKGPAHNVLIYDVEKR